MMNPIKVVVLLAFIWITFISCSKYCDSEKVAESCKVVPSDPYLDSLFQLAVQDARVIEEGENYHLTVVSADNARLHFRIIKDTTYVKCMTWLSRDKESLFEDALKKKDKKWIVPFDEVIWLTIVPELKDFCNSQVFESNESLLLRIKQKLGLSYQSDKMLLGEVWVPLNVLKRPCLDNEINDLTCLTKMEVSVDSDYHEWYFEQRSKVKGNDAFPFTGLGYTYDWGSRQSEFGFSEFVVIGNGKDTIIIDGLFTPVEYCVQKTL